MLNTGYNTGKPSGFEWSDIRIFLYIFLTLGLFIGGIAGCNKLRETPYGIKRDLNDFEEKVIVKTIAEIPQGNYLHRVVDIETNVVCYLNATGGGIKCFHIREIEAMNGKLMPKDFYEKSKDRYSYYSGTYQYSSKKNTVSNALND